MVWYARLREKHLPKPRRLTGRLTGRLTSFQGTQGGVDTHRVDVLQALEEFQSNVPTSKFFYPQSKNHGLSYPKLWSDLDLLGATPIPPIVGVPKEIKDIKINEDIPCKFDLDLLRTIVFGITILKGNDDS